MRATLCISWYTLTIKSTFIGNVGFQPLPFSEMLLQDYAKCDWPRDVFGADNGQVAVAEWMDRLNDSYFPEIQRLCSANSSSSGGRCEVISFSHFLPYQELLPEKRFLTYPNLVSVCNPHFYTCTARWNDRKGNGTRLKFNTIPCASHFLGHKI